MSSEALLENPGLFSASAVAHAERQLNREDGGATGYGGDGGGSGNGVDSDGGYPDDGYPDGDPDGARARWGAHGFWADHQHQAAAAAAAAAVASFGGGSGGSGGGGGGRVSRLVAVGHGLPSKRSTTDGRGGAETGFGVMCFGEAAAAAQALAGAQLAFCRE